MSLNPHSITKFRFSVILCTYNREKYIFQALESIALQDYPNDRYEIVLINNNSTDQTEKICSSFQEKYPEISFSYHVEIQQGLSHARNRGIQESLGELLVYVDDDATVFPEYLQAYDDFFRDHPDEVAAGGPIIPHYEVDPPSWLSHYTKILLTGYLYRGYKTAPFKHGSYPGGGNACYRKEVFEQIGMFNPELGRKGKNLIGAEEKDLFARFMRLRKKIWYIPQAGIYHYIPESKLTEDHFERLTYAIGQSERIRTLSDSKYAFCKRLFSELIKWSASILLFLSYILKGQSGKGKKLIQFRYNVTKGLFGY